MKNIWNAEPTMIVAVVQAFIALIVSFGIHLSSEQVGAIMALTSAILGLVVRSQVHSPAAVEALKAGDGK